jgi:hypothetical protein
MRSRLAAALLLLHAGIAGALPTDDSRSGIPLHQPDAWAMAYVAASTLFSGYGESPALAPGEHALGVELGHIPRLSREEQRVGLGGTKYEDLNKSPLIGRARAWIGLPWDSVLELGFAPPLEIDGAKPEDLFSLALSRRLLTRGRWSLSTRLHAQHGAARGDVTCPAELAGVSNPQLNPFGCMAASDDRIALNQYGLEFSGAHALGDGGWRGHATLGWLRMEPEVHIHADLRAYYNRSALFSSGLRPYLTLGAGRRFGRGYDARVELLYLPLEIRRPGAEPSAEPFWSLRLLLRRGRSD